MLVSFVQDLPYVQNTSKCKCRGRKLVVCGHVHACISGMMYLHAAGLTYPHFCTYGKMIFCVNTVSN